MSVSSPDNVVVAPCNIVYLDICPYPDNCHPDIWPTPTNVFPDICLPGHLSTQIFGPGLVSEHLVPSLLSNINKSGDVHCAYYKILFDIPDAIIR